MTRAEHENPPVEELREEDPLVERVDEVPAAAAHGPAAGQEPLAQGPAAGQAPQAQLAGADEHAGFVARWQEIQAEFVDEPRKAVHDADALVTDLMQRLAEMLASERDQLESRIGASGDVSTEDLRQGLRRYRSLFERLLAA
jgi:hypothetical protein